MWTVLTYDAAEAVYESELVAFFGEENYSIFLFNEAEPDYPYIALDLYPESKDTITGLYSLDDFTLGEYTYYQFGKDDNDYSDAVEAQVAITLEGNIYTISGYMTCKNKNTYNFTFTGEMPFYLDTDYYGDEDQAIENVPALDTQAQMFDVLGRPVGKGYKGFVIQNGYKYMVR